MLDSARSKAPVPALARWLLGLGIAATLTANVAHGAVPGDLSDWKVHEGDVHPVAVGCRIVPPAVEARGEAGWACRLVPLMVDGLTDASSRGGWSRISRAVSSSISG
jgi:hypothetical protein